MVTTRSKKSKKIVVIYLAKILKEYRSGIMAIKVLKLKFQKEKKMGAEKVGENLVKFKRVHQRVKLKRKKNLKSFWTSLLKKIKTP